MSGITIISLYLRIQTYGELFVYLTKHQTLGRKKERKEKKKRKGIRGRKEVLHYSNYSERF